MQAALDVSIAGPPRPPIAAACKHQSATPCVNCRAAVTSCSPAYAPTTPQRMCSRSTVHARTYPPPPPRSSMPVLGALCVLLPLWLGDFQGAHARQSSALPVVRTSPTSTVVHVHATGHSDCVLQVVTHPLHAYGLASKQLLYAALYTWASICLDVKKRMDV